MDLVIHFLFIGIDKFELHGMISGNIIQQVPDEQGKVY